MRKAASIVVALGLLFGTRMLASDPVEYAPVGWNAETMTNGNIATTRFGGSWMNYLEGGVWKKIEPIFKYTGTGFILERAPYRAFAPLRADGVFRFEDKHTYDPISRETFTAPTLGKTKRFLQAQSVPGTITTEGILYENAFPDIHADLLVTATTEEVRYLTVFRSAPTGAVEIPYVQTFDGIQSVGVRTGTGYAASSMETERDVGKGRVVRLSKHRSIYQGQATVWDGQQTRKIQVKERRQGNTIFGRKLIPASVFKDFNFPIYTDTTDSFTASTSDCGIVSNDASFASYRAGSNLALETETNPNLYVVNWNASPYFGYRAYLWWDTSALPDTATISAASVDVYYADTHASISRTSYLVENRQASTTLATTDWGLIGASGVGTGAGQPYASITRSSGEAAGTKTFTINATGITKVSKTGNTYFAFISAYDWDNSAPPNESTAGSNFNSANAASNKPILSITYTLSSASAPPQVLIFL